MQHEHFSTQNHERRTLRGNSQGLGRYALGLALAAGTAMGIQAGNETGPLHQDEPKASQQHYVANLPDLKIAMPDGTVREAESIPAVQVEDLPPASSVVVPPQQGEAVPVSPIQLPDLPGVNEHVDGPRVPDLPGAYDQLPSDNVPDLPGANDELPPNNVPDLPPATH